jgi:radical SAM protein with 4Fe4S-binding SPASM domain
MTPNHKAVSISPTVCAVPWMHLNFEPSGKVITCCLTSSFQAHIGDLKTQSIEEIWNSDKQKAIRKDMMEGREPAVCSKCFDRERVTGESGRIYHNRDFPGVVKSIPDITLEDGTCTTMNLKYWDFRFSNLCNFKCRSCGPRYSSAWVPDAKKLGYTDQEKVWSIENVDDQTNYSFLKEQIDVVRRIYFAGGEPLLMPEHWQILDMLVEKKRFDVKLSYNTNCSVLEYNKKNIVDYWSQWHTGKLEIWPSIDEIGERAEIIRSGTVWSTIDNNLKKLTKIENALIRPHITVAAWNVHRLPEIIEYFISIEVVCEKWRYQNFYLNLLEYPQYYNIQILSDEFKKATVNKLEKFIQEYNAKYNVDISHLLKYTLHELAKPHSEHLARKFLNITASVDTVRNEKLLDVVPELQQLKDRYENQ